MQILKLFTPLLEDTPAVPLESMILAELRAQHGQRGLALLDQLQSMPIKTNESWLGTYHSIDTRIGVIVAVPRLGKERREKGPLAHRRYELNVMVSFKPSPLLNLLGSMLQLPSTMTINHGELPEAHHTVHSGDLLHWLTPEVRAWRCELLWRAREAVEAAALVRCLIDLPPSQRPKGATPEGNLDVTLHWTESERLDALLTLVNREYMETMQKGKATLHKTSKQLLDKLGKSMDRVDPADLHELKLRLDRAAILYKARKPETCAEIAYSGLKTQRGEHEWDEMEFFNHQGERAPWPKGV